MPRLLNPPSGWVQNSNDPPWLATLPARLDPGDFPAYFAPPPSLAARPRQGVHLLGDTTSMSLT